MLVPAGSGLRRGGHHCCHQGQGCSNRNENFFHLYVLNVVEVIPPGPLHHRRSRLKATPPSERFICPISEVSIPHLVRGSPPPRCQPTSLSASSVVRIGFSPSSSSSMTAGSPSRSMPRDSHALKASGSLSRRANSCSGGASATRKRVWH